MVQRRGANVPQRNRQGEHISLPTFQCEVPIIWRMLKAHRLAGGRSVGVAHDTLGGTQRKLAFAIGAAALTLLAGVIVGDKDQLLLERRQGLILTPATIVQRCLQCIYAQPQSHT